LDTPENSAEHVKKWLKDGPDWYGEDDKGRYCDSCWDFAHFVGDYSFPVPDLYQTDIDAPVDYITLDGTKERAEADQGDQGMHRIVFPFLKVGSSRRSILCSAGADPSVPTLCTNERKTIRRVLDGGNLKARHA
jgi:hypothetical protein